ncbi:hypothetical protein [uncultured Polaribacter sp.]|uniref:hypothetical protein n=1 Tax=uncultured Polaribacter sp. TaxID=174711 RepID=UPI0030DB925C|tara:strand:+ start:4477 stop:5061 length:585 start_codon:yes stop_codon:yes gene_type:complete
MKTIKQNVLVVALMLVTLCNYANNEKDFNNIVNAKNVKVVFEDVKKGQQLTVNDENGVELHSELLTKEGELTKVFDLSSLNDGLYTIELNKEFLVVIKYLEVKDNKVIFIDNSEQVIFKPLIKNEGDLVLISKLDFNENPLKVTLFFEGDMILSETIKSELIINRVYKLNKELKGNYTVVVNSNGKSYSSFFKI